MRPCCLVASVGCACAPPTHRTGALHFAERTLRPTAKAARNQKTRIKPPSLPRTRSGGAKNAKKSKASSLEEAKPPTTAFEGSPRQGHSGAVAMAGIVVPGFHFIPSGLRSPFFCRRSDNCSPAGMSRANRALMACQRDEKSASPAVSVGRQLPTGGMRCAFPPYELCCFRWPRS